MLSLSIQPSSSCLTPQRLILDLLDADPQAMAFSRRLLAAGGVFNFTSNQMRVSLSRLVSDGLLEKPSRGLYQLSERAARLRTEIQRWRHLEQQLIPWHGNWLAIACGNLAADSSAHFRRQQRALALRGLQRWRLGIWVRPDNLHGGLEQLVIDLQALDLDAIQGSFRIEQADDSCQRELISLWDSLVLDKEYQQRLVQLRDANERLTNASPALLSETMELGSDTVRFLLMDPLLPEELVNHDNRRALVAAMVDYDAKGRKLWQQFIDALEA